MKGEAGCIVPVNSAQLLPNRLQHASTHQHLNLAVPALASFPLDLTDPGKHHHQTDVVFFPPKAETVGKMHVFRLQRPWCPSCSHSPCLLE